MAKKESALQREIKAYLEGKGCLVQVFTNNGYQIGPPDLWVHDPSRHSEIEGQWVDVKRPKGGTLTHGQARWWPRWESRGVGIWIMIECDDAVLFEPPNWREWWRPRYEKYALKSPSDILEEGLKDE